MSGPARGRARVADGRSIAEPILTDAVFGFEVDQDRGPRQPPDDLVLEVMGHLVGSLEADPGGELEVEVDLMLAADMSCAQVVESNDLLAQKRIDDLSDLAELLLGQCFVGEATPAVEQDPNTRNADCSGYDQADHGVDPMGTGHLDRDQGREHPQRHERVRA